MKKLSLTAALLALTLGLPAHADTVITPANLEKLQAASPEIAPLLQESSLASESESDENKPVSEADRCDLEKRQAFIREKLQKHDVYDSVDAIARKHGLDSAEQYAVYLQATMAGFSAGMKQTMMQNLAQRAPEAAEEMEAQFREDFPCVGKDDLSAAAEHKAEINQLMQAFAAAAQPQQP
ncbi:hypothetical protein [Microbulbifer halophilus]|uniref:DUF2059 domain-containing protein n=1 Tax=Microbulbifer halophilus TaxID=453963 RepID=A0ABW5E774_9GAMM|nr:hypothetical protein [Microbulbifer halophilus]MCW8125615.1 hypothetical protein [Microbulbifer halophilus]